LPQGSIASFFFPKALDDIRVNYLGKKGEITALLKTLGGMDPEERKTAGQEINLAKVAVQQAIEARKTNLVVLPLWAESILYREH